MKTFIGTKLVEALPMDRAAYNIYRNWELPSDEDGTDPGYLVEYLDGGNPNHPDHTGYISWSPKEQFDNAYRKASGVSFGLAVEAMKKGFKVFRSGWNGRDMWVSLVTTGSYRADTNTIFPNYDKACEFELSPWIGIKTADHEYVPWLASQTEILADDWVIDDLSNNRPLINELSDSCLSPIRENKRKVLPVRKQ